MTTDAPSPTANTPANSSPAPCSDLDLFAEDILLDPYPSYEALRDLGPAVWMTTSLMWAIPRYDALRTVLADWETFSSAQGIAIDPGFSAMLQGAFVALDPPEHRTQRNVLAANLSVRSLRSHQQRIETLARQHVDRCLQHETFDAVTDLAQPFPIEVISSLIGFSKVPVHKLAAWASAGFQVLGSANQRALDVVQLLGELDDFLGQQARPGAMPANSFGAVIHAAAQRGVISDVQAQGMLRAFATAGVDTTISSLSSALWLFARYPEQWNLLREDPTRIRAAFDEVLRLESPVQAFARTTTQDHTIGGTRLAEGDRIMVLYGSANRDPARWENPDEFDITREPKAHLAFGHGVHVCPGLRTTGN